MICQIYDCCLGDDGAELLNPLPDNNISDWSKLKEFAEDNFRHNENGREFSKTVENTVGKGGIAHYKQFLFFPLRFQKICNVNT